MKIKGKVKWFSSEKGYGFITAYNGKDHYFNVRDIIGTDLPSKGDFAKFKSKKGNKGLWARNVEIITKATKQAVKDDRVECSNCNRKIVPEIIIRDGRVEHFLCPYCGEIVKDFNSNWIASITFPKSIIIGIVIFIIYLISKNFNF